MKRLSLVRTYVALGVAVLAASVIAGCGGPGTGTGGTQAGPEIVDGGVLFRFFDAEATRVNIVGDFNNWSLHSDPMVDKNGDGEWTLFYSLGPGSYEYKFVIDGVTWIHDPRNPTTAPDGFDGLNSVVRVSDRK